MLRHRQPLALLFCALVITLAGCPGQANKPPDLTPVTGTITVDGKPSSRVTVWFVPKAGTPGNGGSGQTDGRGKYTLQQAGGLPGVPPGEYDVTFSKFVLPDGTGVKPDIQPESVGAVQALPERYTDASTSEIAVTVTEGSGPFDFALESE